MAKNLRILLIDDDDVDRMTVKRALKKAGLPVIFQEAADASSGLEQLRKDKFSCVFLDYLLPDKDGLNTLQTARSFDPLTPIVMLTGHGDERLAVKMMQAGANDYVPKSEISPENLSQALNRATRLFQAELERRQAEEELQLSNKRIGDILESISDAFFAIDGDWNITYLNQQAQILLHKDREELLEKNLHQQMQDLPPWFREAVTKAIAQKKPVTAEGFHEPLGVWLEANAYPGHEGVSVYFRDISERKSVEERLSFLANYDALTGLPNRVLLLDRLKQNLSRVPWHCRNVALLFCDLDRFKLVNDTLGHNAGDHLLKNIADRLQSCVRSGDTVARLGGDEFVVLLNDVAKPDDITKIAKKIIQMVSVPLNLFGQEVYVTASIGISIAPNDGQDPETLIKHADIAMYRAKEEGKNTYQYYSPSMSKRASERLILESALHRAIEMNELKTFYQPKVDLKTGIIVGAEALVRWEHPERGLIPPNDFLPLAEESDLIIAIDDQMLANACTQAKCWQLAGYSPLIVSVNLSDRQFKRENLYQTICAALEKYGLESECLELELTEKIIMQSLDSATATLDKLRDLGVQLSIDDFGTGYSSLTQLQRCPIDTLKIDRSFIRDIETSQNNSAITEAIIAMAHKLNIKVIAEGVETEAQKRFLIERNCQQAQGYLYSPPVPPEEFEKLLCASTEV